MNQCSLSHPGDSVFAESSEGFRVPGVTTRTPGFRRHQELLVPGVIRQYPVFPESPGNTAFKESRTLPVSWSHKQIRFSGVRRKYWFPKSQGTPCSRCLQELRVPGKARNLGSRSHPEL